MGIWNVHLDPQLMFLKEGLFCGDWGGILTYFGLNARSGQFIFDFDPFKLSVFMFMHLFCLQI